MQFDDIDEEESDDGDDGGDDDPDGAKARGRAAMAEVQRRHAAEAAAAASAAEQYDPSAEIEDAESSDDDDEDLSYIPAPRASSTVKKSIAYTPRLFPTPMRESSNAQEQNWVAQNRSHLATHPYFGKRSSDISVTESDPTWLKGKADDFYRLGDFRSAVNAYGSAIDIDGSQPALYSNRAACYLQLGELDACVGDCAKGLSLLLRTADALERSGTMGAKMVSKAAAEMEPAAAASMRVKLLVRRGTAHCQLGAYGAGHADYSAAHALSGGADPALAADVARVETLVRCDALKREGDAHFGAREMGAALAKYGEALAADAGFVSCLSNRAVCHLTMGSCQACVDDCSRALELLQQDAAKGTLPCAMPASGTTKRRQWVLKTLVRRATANAQLGNLEEAIADYQIAVQIEPSSESLAADLATLQAKASEASEASEAQALEQEEGAAAEVE